MTGLREVRPSVSGSRSLVDYPAGSSEPLGPQGSNGVGEGTEPAGGAEMGHRTSRNHSLSQWAWLALLSVVSVIPFWVAEFPPLLDYPQWVFQGYLVMLLLSGADAGQGAALPYMLNWAPIPNLAAPLGIGLLNFWLPPQQAGRVFGATCVLLFSYGFAYMMRSTQRRPTAIELLGPVWAYGYFMYSGFLSYVLSLGIAFFAIGSLTRLSAGARCACRKATACC